MGVSMKFKKVVLHYPVYFYFLSTFELVYIICGALSVFMYDFYVALYIKSVRPKKSIHIMHPKTIYSMSGSSNTALD